MSPLRRLQRLSRFVLAWFVLALGVAAVAPAVQPAQFEWVCSANGGGALVVHQADGSPIAQAHAAQCALCVLLAPPPDFTATLAALAFDNAEPLSGYGSHPPSLDSAAPFPPRGPPHLS